MVSRESTARESPLVVLMDKSPAGRYSVLFGLGPCTPCSPLRLVFNPTRLFSLFTSSLCLRAFYREKLFLSLFNLSHPELDRSLFPHEPLVTPLLPFDLFIPPTCRLDPSGAPSLALATRPRGRHLFDAFHAMTTASSSKFATMEVPALEDSMEMASPYHGGADDFDIDIDLMEDQVSNMDSDMMGADDYPNTSQVSLFGTEANDDADMADEPSEGSMVDTDLVDEDPDIDVQYDETTYEAEMLEGDQDDELVAPVPSIHIEVQTGTTEQGDPSSGIPTEIDEVQLQPTTHDGPETAPPETAVSESVPVVNEPQESQTQDEEAPPVSSENQTDQLGRTEGDNHAESQTNHSALELQDTNGTTEEKPPTAEEHVDASAENVENVEPVEEAKSTVDENGDGHVEHLEANVSHEKEGQETHEEDESLHPVKVLYQEAEISLFPPMEGDSAETFFLHDEDIAYDHVGKLFNSLREVLLDNVAENEVLVIDIDSLGIQITEVSPYSISCSVVFY